MPSAAHHSSFSRAWGSTVTGVTAASKAGRKWASSSSSGTCGSISGVELAVGQAEAAAEALAVEGGDVVFPEHRVGGLDHRAEVVHQRAGPIEDEVAEHGADAEL